MGRRKKQTFLREPTADSHTFILKPFACGLCEEKFTDIRTFYKHFPVHKEVTSKHFHLCDCDCLEPHTNNDISREEQFVCDACYVKFPTICQLHWHMEATEDIESYKVLLENRRVYPEPAVCINTTFNSSKLKSKCIVKIQRLPSTPNVEVKEMQHDSYCSVGNLGDCMTAVGDNKAGTFDELVNDDTTQKIDSAIAEKSQEFDINKEIGTFKCEMNQLQYEDNDDVSFDDIEPEIGNEKSGLQTAKSEDDFFDVKVHDINLEQPKDITIDHADIKVATKEEVMEQSIENTKTVKRKRRRGSNVHYCSNRKLRKELRIQKEKYRKKKLPVKSELCGICQKRYSFGEIEAHKLEHLKETGCDLDLNEENGNENDAEMQPKIRPQRNKSISFIKYADSDIDSEDDFDDTVSEKKEYVEKKGQGRKKIKLDLVKTEVNEEKTVGENKKSNEEILAQKVFAPDIGQNDGETNASDISKSELDLILEEVKAALDKGKKNFEFKYDGLSFIKTPKRLMIFCPFCGLKITGNRFKSHVTLEHASIYKSRKDILQQVHMVNRKSQGIVVEDTETINVENKCRSVTDKLNTYVKPEMTVTQIKEAKRRFRKKEFYRNRIDYDWDCVPNRTRKKQNFLLYYETCKLCGILIKLSRMEGHLAEHKTEKGKQKFSPENLIKCKECARVCTRLGFRQHMCFRELVEKNKKTSEESEPDVKEEKSKTSEIICSECGMLVKRVKMKVHLIQVHSDEKPYTCTICGKSFKMLGALNYHMKQVHVAERNFHCDQCTKAFSTSSALKEHYRSHTDERQFQCPKCPKRFRKMYNVKVHMQAMHESGLPKFQCPHCFRRVKNKFSLTEHIKRVHMNLKSWMCSWPDCGEQFFNSRILRRHMCRHTGEKPLTCDYCECAYVQPTELLAHLKNKHNVNTLPPSKKSSFKVKSYERYIFDMDTKETDGQKMKSIMFQASNATLAHNSPLDNTHSTQKYNSTAVTTPSTQTYNSPVVTTPSTQKYNSTVVTTPSTRTYNSTAVTTPSTRTYNSTAVTTPSTQTYNSRAVTARSTRTYNSTAVTAPSTRTYNSTAVTTPSTRTYNSTAVTAPSTQTYNSTAVTAPSTQTYNSRAVTAPSTRTFNSTAVTTPSTRTYNSTAVTAPSTRTYNSTFNPDI